MVVDEDDFGVEDAEQDRDVDFLLDPEAADAGRNGGQLGRVDAGGDLDGAEVSDNSLKTE